MTHHTRVLMVSRLFHPWVGGTERQAAKLTGELISRGIDARVVTGRWFRGTPRRETIETIPVFRNHTLWEFFGIKGLRRFGGYLYIITLIRYLVSNQASFDVIHVHGLNYHTFAAVVAAKRIGKPVVVKLANSGSASDIRRMQDGRQLALSRLMLPTALGCDRFVALNPAVVEELQQAGVDRERIVEIPNGVETAGIRPRATYRTHQIPTLVYVGRLHPQKDLPTLLSAVEMAGEVRLRLVGDGPQRQELEVKATELGIDAEFLGSIEDVSQALESADVFVLPSLVEGLSNALLEAMAAGLPVIVSNIPGNLAAVTDDVDGVTFDPGDPGTLADAIRRLLADEGLRGRLGRAAAATVTERFSLSQVTARYVDLYREMIDERSPVLVGEGAP